jgi:hypothetical protein
VEKDSDARALKRNDQQEAFKHIGMELVILIRRKSTWRTVLQEILFKKGDIVEHGEEAEEKVD